MKSWDDIVTAALLGTERQGFILPAAGGALGETLNRLPAETAEARLLGCAAIVSAYARAGLSLPEEPHPLPPEAPLEERGFCSPEAERRLLMLLNGELDKLKQFTPGLLREWLTLANRGGRLVSPSALAGLLEAGQRSSDLRPLIAPLLGRRGAWLARQNPEWAYATGAAEDSGEAAWTDGTLPERLAWFKRLRTRDPQAARQRLEAVWPREPAQNRAALLDFLGVGLSMEDEAFLEEALDNRSKEVRRVAGALLALLPESRFSQRMGARAGALIQLSKGLLGGAKMKVALPPEEPDAAWRRDGLEPEPGSASGGMGARALSLKKLVSAVPLQHWTSQVKLAPAELIDCARKTEWPEAIVGGWAEAARRQHNVAWTLALLEKARGKNNEFREADLLPGLGDHELEQFILRKIQALKPVDRISPLYSFLAPTTIALGPELTRAALVTLREGLVSKSSHGYLKVELLAAVSMRGALAVRAEAEAMARDVIAQNTEWNGMLYNFLAVYEFRCAMHKELS